MLLDPIFNEQTAACEEDALREYCEREHYRKFLRTTETGIDAIPAEELFA